MKRYYYVLIVIIFFTILNSCRKKTVKSYSPQNKECDLSSLSGSHGDYYAPKTKDNIFIDGLPKEDSWNNAPWKEIKYDWAGTQYTAQNFYGRYRILWDENQIYFLIETTDNNFLMQVEDSSSWKNEDYLDIYLDEGRTKNEDEYKREPIIYSINGNERIVLNEKKLLNKDFIQVKRTNMGNVSIWELAMKVVKNTSNDVALNKVDLLNQDEVIGFAIAYHDYDGPAKKENFVGSIKMIEINKKHAGKDVSSLGILELIK